MKKDLLKQWLKDQRSILDEIICEAALEYYKENNLKQNFEYDLGQCQIESYNLIKGIDLCYDRPNTAFVYSLWYHARRVNTFLSFFSEALIDTEETAIDIFDLGAGTGAVQWSIGLIYSGMIELGLSVPSITIINVDSSPFMLSYSENYLWKFFIKKYKLCTEPSFVIKYSVNTWSNSDQISLTNPWIVSSYLFDMSDNKDEINKNFNEIIETFKPSNLLLLTSDQPKKRQFLTDIKTSLTSQGYYVKFESKPQNLLYQGGLNKVNSLRSYLNSLHPSHGLGNNATWNDASFVGLALSKQQISLPIKVGIKLFIVSEKNRSKIILGPDQIKATRPTGRPTVIMGPAGCGKSVVLTERVKNVIKLHNYDPNLKILVTTFNRDLVKVLGDWIEQLLDKTRFKRRFGENAYGRQPYSYFTFHPVGSSIKNISVLHFDVIPTQIVGISGNVLPKDESHREILKRIADEQLELQGYSVQEFSDVCNPSFLLDEYHRVIYGQQVNKYKDNYSTIERIGRGVPKLNHNSKKRQFVWNVIRLYLTHLNGIKMNSFITLRRKALNKLKTGKPFEKFDYVFVDELQDCVDADFELFYSMVKDPNNVVLTGDLSQSIHIGSSSRYTPRSQDGSMRRFEKISLVGSYRLPFRISESLKGLSEKINSKRNKTGNSENGDIINPFKGSPPGARPIIVYSNSIVDISNKIKEIYKSYKLYETDIISVFEEDNVLCSNLGRINARYESIRWAKGLEKSCVLWSTRISTGKDNDVEEAVYTILTRTCAILIIALFDDTLPIYTDVLASLNIEKLIFWDAISKSKYQKICSIKMLETEDEDDPSGVYVGEQDDPLPEIFD